MLDTSDRYLVLQTSSAYNTPSIYFQNKAKTQYLLQQDSIGGYVFLPTQSGGLDTLSTLKDIRAKADTGIDLQYITDNGNYTTNSIVGGGGIWSIDEIYGINSSGDLKINNIEWFGNGSNLYSNATTSRNYALPDNSGTIMLTSDTTNKWVNNITRTLGKDSIIYYIGSTRYAIKDSVGTNPAPVGYYGAFEDNTIQTAAAINTPYAMKFGINDLSNGITIASDGSNLTRITIANTGIYNIQFSAQFDRTNSGTDAVDIWLRKNGVDVPGSAGKIILTGGAAASAIIAAWNYVLDIVSGDYYQIMWSTPDTHVRILYEAAQTSPFAHPIIPSTILTVTQQSGIMAGTGITAINSLTGAAQTIVEGTDSSDFKIVSSGTTHKFNLPTASAIKRGALSSSDWTTFNNKVNISDSSTMLSTYLRKNDTASLSNRINLKLNATDTSSLSTRINAKQNTLTNPVTGTGTTGAIAKFTGTSTIGDATVDVDYLQQDMSLVAMQAMGSSIKGYNLCVPNMSLITISYASITSGLFLLYPIYIPKTTTITGVRWFQTTQGNYTANNYNGVALYSVSGGTLTRVDSSANDGTIWKTSSNSWGSKAFSNTYSASSGIYYVGILYSSSAQTTAPAFGASATTINAFVKYSDFTNSLKLSQFQSSITILPTTISAGSTSSTSNNVALYLY